MLRPTGLVLGLLRTAPNSSAQYQEEGLAGIGKRAPSPGVHPRPEVLPSRAEIDNRLIDMTLLAPALTAKVTQEARRGTSTEGPGDKDRYIDRYYIPGISPDSQHDPRAKRGTSMESPGDPDTAKQARITSLETAVKAHMQRKRIKLDKALHTGHA